MPIALLLASLKAPLSGLDAAFGRWNAVLRLETVVIDRARGAFMVHWFGPRLPSSEGRLRVVIDNIVPLGERYREARSRSMGGQTGPHLLEPVAGLAGTFAGMLISPSGALTYMYAQLRGSIGAILSATLTVLYSPHFIAMFTGLGGAVAVVLLPFALIAGIVAAAIASAPGNSLVLAYEAIGELARVLRAMTRLIDVFTGPRDAITNPLLRRILGVLDRFAALLAQLIGAAAWLVTRIGPQVLRYAIEFSALRQLAGFSIDLARRLLGGAFEQLAQLWRSEEGERASPWAMVLGMFDHVMVMAGRMAGGAGAALAELGRRLDEGFARIADTSTGHARLVGDAAIALIGVNPLIRSFRAAAAMATAVRSIIGAGSGGSRASPPPASGSAIPSALAPAGLAVGLLDVPPPPGLASAEAMVAAARASGSPVTSPWGADFTASMAEPFELDAATQALARQLSAPPASVFSGERRAMSEELGGRSVEEGLDLLRSHELRYRGLVHDIVGRVLPAQVRARMPVLMDAFDALDRFVHGRGDADARADFPVRDLPDNGLLRPVVRRLVVRSADGDEVSLRNIATDLAHLLRERPYPVPAG